MGTHFSWADGVYTAGLFSALSLLVVLVVRVAFAAGVYEAGRRLERQGQETELVAPLWWAGATLGLGLVAALAFWGIHFSPLLRRQRKATSFEGRREALRQRRQGPGA